MQSNNRKIRVWFWVAIVLLVVVLVGGWFNRVAKKEVAIDVVESKPLLTPVSYEPVKKIEKKTEVRTEQVVQPVKDSLKHGKEVTEVNLAVPFSPQAPHANWDQHYQDACEEAAVIMVERFISGRSLTADLMDKEILKMVAWEEKTLGFFKDTNIAETVQLVNEYYPALKAKAVYDITVADIKAQLQQGQPVVVLANGQKIGNPYYTAPGPEKHALVIKGFTNGKFITNDPGTRRGADYVYTKQHLYNAIGDYDGRTAGTGKKAMVIISSNVGS